MLQRVKIPLRSLFTTYHHHLALVCTSYSHLMLWALVYWLRSQLLLVHGCVSKLQSCVTLLIAETTQDTYLLLCGKMIYDNNNLIFFTQNNFLVSSLSQRDFPEFENSSRHKSIQWSVLHLMEHFLEASAQLILSWKRSIKVLLIPAKKSMFMY